MSGNDHKVLIQELIEDTDEQFSDEELMHLLLAQKVTAKTERSQGEKLTLGQRAADAVARFAGSWAFIFSFLGMMLVWMILNILMAAGAFDPYPFILLNLVLSCIAAVQAPLIMMSQNRQEEKDRTRAENDYKVNLKNELVIADLHDKLDTVLKNQRMILKKISAVKAVHTDNESDEEG